jgi:hypothetical protein
VIGLLPQPGGSSANEGEVVQRLRSGLVQEFEHELSADAIEVAGATDDVEPEVASLKVKVALDLDVAEATDLTVEVIGPPTPQRVVLADLAHTTATTDPVVAIPWIEELSPEPERGLVWVRVEDVLFDNREVVIERGRGWDREEGQPERGESRGDDEFAHDASLGDEPSPKATLPQRRRGVKAKKLDADVLLRRRPRSISRRTIALHAKQQRPAPHPFADKPEGRAIPRHPGGLALPVIEVPSRSRRAEV